MGANGFLSEKIKLTLHFMRRENLSLKGKIVKLMEENGGEYPCKLE